MNQLDTVSSLTVVESVTLSEILPHVINDFSQTSEEMISCFAVTESNGNGYWRSHIFN